MISGDKALRGSNRGASMLPRIRDVYASAIEDLRPHLVLLLLFAAACQPEPPAETDVAPPVEAQDTASAPEDPQPVRLALDPALLLPDSVFPHSEHRSVTCTTCHQNVTGHGPHQELPCSSCHDVPEGYTALPVRSDRECLACHHRQVGETGCSRCHSGGPPGNLPVRVSFASAGGTRVHDRAVAFNHRWHDQLECARCHSEDVTFAVEQGCASCHESHHTPEARCASCHVDALSMHDADAHRGCEGAACHTEPTVTRLPGSRAVCLACHEPQADHKPGRECAECHKVAPSGAARSRGGGS